jgi:hypothetical protein
MDVVARRPQPLGGLARRASFQPPASNMPQILPPALIGIGALTVGEDDRSYRRPPDCDRVEQVYSNDRGGLMSRAACVLTLILAAVGCAAPAEEGGERAEGEPCQRGDQCQDELYCGCPLEGSCGESVCLRLPGGSPPASAGLMGPTRRWLAQVPTIAALDWAAFPIPLEQRPAPTGRTLVVAPWGSDAEGDGSFEAPWRSLRRGVQAAAAGDWVVARGGLYEEGPEGEFIALELGEASSGVVVAAFQGEPVVVRPARVGINYGLSVWGDQIAVHGLRFEGFPQAGAVLGRQGRTTRGIALSSMTFVFEGDAVTNGIAVVPDNGGEPVIEGLLLRDVRVTGASIGIQCNVGPCDHVRMEGVVVVGQGRGESSALDGIASERGRNYLLLDVEVSEAGADGIDLKVADVAVIGAFVHHVGRNGIKLWRGGDVVNAVVSHTGADTAVSFGEAGRYRLLHAVVAYHNFGGLNAYSLTAGYQQPGEGFQIEILNSAFFRNAGGLYLPAGASVVVDNNLFAEIDNQDILTAWSPLEGAQKTFELSGGAEALETHGLGSGNLPVGLDPGFVAPQEADYQLRDGSPLLGAARAVDEASPLDLAGSARPQGSGPDVGAYER